MNREDLLKELLWSTQEILDSLSNELVMLEKDPRDSSLVDSIYRAFHSVKGASCLVELPFLEIITHECEHILELYRQNIEIVDGDGIQLLIDGTEHIAAILTNLKQTGDEGLIDVQSFLQRCAAETQRLGVSAGVGKDEAANAGPEHVTAESQQSLAAGSGVDQVVPVSDTDTKTSADPAPVVAEPVGQGLSVATTSSSADAPAPAPAAAVAGSVGDSTVRISVELLDRLMNQVGELVLARNQVLQAVDEFDSPVLMSTTRVLDQVTSELQESVMQTRMQPISVITDKFSRIIRDLSRQLDKEVDLLVE
ncbi:MAG: Hpt domain-containing protein, partial [Planctomycetota bacterium]